MLERPGGEATPEALRAQQREGGRLALVIVAGFLQLKPHFPCREVPTFGADVS